MAKYWLSTISLQNFEIDRANDFYIAGFEERHLKKVIQVEAGDRFAYYVKGKGFGLVCTILDRCYLSWKPIWQGGIFPCRFERHCELVMPSGKFLHPRSILSQLSFVPPYLKSGNRWGLAFHSNLRLITESDFQVIEDEMRRLAPRCV
ncbi:MAG: hypothetical protein AAB037_03805 [Chloroflexota bacterium]